MNSEPQSAARITLGANIKQLRSAQQLTKHKLAEMAGISRPTLHNIEIGSGNPTIAVIEKLAEALGVEPADLFQSRG